MRAIFIKDLRAGFTSLRTYLFMAAFLVFGGLYFTRFTAALSLSQADDLFADLSVILAFLLPVLSMPSFASEHRSGTDKLLLSGPVSVAAIVLGKFLALLCIYAFTLLLCLVIPLVVLLQSGGHAGALLLCALGLFLFGMAALALGVFISSLTAHPFRCLTLNLLVLLVLWLLFGVLPHVGNPILNSILSVFSLFGRLEAFVYGYLQPSAILYLFTFAIFFLLLTCKSIDLRRANKV
ncbi:MAG: ABC transporter permease subunit [Christensenellaceae bacterium]|nr:ABC transporter permease subunit [Christensenellaceae bacterium]